MTAHAYALFDTPIGCCGIAWSARGLVDVQLPDADVAATRERLARRHSQAREVAPEAQAQAAIDSIVALLQGQPADLSGIELDMEAVPAFHRRVYEHARTIPPGSTSTYAEVAAALGERSAARAVGRALGHNPFAIVVPCHRVLAAGGAAGGFSAPGGTLTKLKLLEIEGALGMPLFDQSTG